MVVVSLDLIKSSRQLNRVYMTSKADGNNFDNAA